MTITIDPTKAQAFTTAMQTGEGVNPPFAVAYFWVTNGNPALKAAGGVQYFGGWSADTENLTEVCEGSGLEQPANLVPYEMVKPSGQSVPLLGCRSLIVAPIGMRTSWVKDQERRPDYRPGFRHHVQVLSWLGVKEKNKFVSWGPVVLSAKGYQTNKMLDAFKEWKQFTAPLLAQVAPGVPSQLFYVPIGTFGKKPKIEMVGKGASQSPITPIRAFLKDGMTAKEMENLFVGEDVAELMHVALMDAKPWLEAWGEEQQDTKTNGAPEEDDYWPADDGPLSDDPF